MSQIQAAGEQMHRLGGLGARLVLLRPGRVFSKAQRLLASARRLDVLDQAEMPSAFSRLADLLGIALPERLQGLEKLLRSAPQPLFVRGKYKTRSRQKMTTCC